MEVFELVFWLIPPFLILIYWLKKSYSFWQLRGVKTPPFRYFWGNFYDVAFHRDSLCGLIQKSYDFFKSKNVVHGGIYSFFSPIYIPIDVNIIEAILKSDWEHFTGRGLYHNEKDDPLSGHLFRIEGPKWKFLRRKFTPTFTASRLKTMFEMVRDCAISMDSVLENMQENSLNTKNLLNRFSTDVISKCALGIECDTLNGNDEELYENVSDFFDLGFWENIKLFLADDFPDLMKFFRVRVHRVKVIDFITNLIRQTVDYREKNNVFRNDFIHLMIQLKDKGKLDDDLDGWDGEKVSIEDICAQSFVFFLGGFDSSSNTVSFCLFLLAIHKNIQDDVRMEIRDIVAKNNGKLSYEAIKKMVLLDKVIQETMRMYPPIPFLIRSCTKTYRIPNTDLILEKGQKIFIPTMAIHNDKNYYPDPEKFDPERFSGYYSKIRPCTFLPFGDGPRNCLAYRFGMMHTKIGLIVLLQNNEFFPNEKTINPPQFDTKNPLVLSSKGGNCLGFKRI